MKKSLIIKLIFIVMIIGLPIIIFLLRFNVSNANMDRYVVTDKNIFGEDALIINGQEDQSEKLQKCIKKASLDRKELFIPAGKYYINKSVNLTTSNISITGDKEDATILINKDNAPDVILNGDNYVKNVENIRIENLFFDGIQIIIRDKPNITIENNIFYNSNGHYIVYVYCGNNTNINHNIFLRDAEHAVLNKEGARTIYVGGYAWGKVYKWAENVTIRDNLIGAKINELDAIKSLLQNENKINVVKLQKMIKENKIKLKNEQNVITTGVNSYYSLKNARIENNFIYLNYDDQEWNKNPIEHDHATYLRGSQNVYMSGNHIRGLHNGSSGGFKFKSGRDIVLVNNYIRNSGVELSIIAEYGLTETIEEGKTAQFTRILLANNIFDFKAFDRSYGIGINMEKHYSEKGSVTIDGNVFIDNKYINYLNVHPINNHKREGIQLEKLSTPENTYIKGNIRDDTADKHLTNWRWTKVEEDRMPKDWRSMLSKAPSLEEYYNNKKNIQIPFLNLLATAVPTTAELGHELNAEKLVKNAYDKDNKKPTFTITNPQELKTVGKKELIVKIQYLDQIPEVNITVPVTVQDTISPKIEIKKSQFERGEEIKISDIVNVTDLDKNLDIKMEPQINEMSIGVQNINIIALDSSGNRAEKNIEIVIKKGKLQQEIENLFDINGKIKPDVKIEKVNLLENEAQKVKNIILKNEFIELLDKAKKQIKNKELEEKISVNVNKQWNDNSNSNQKRPTSIKYVLKGGSISKEQVVTGNRTTNEGWNYTFTNVPKYNEQGNEIQYTVEEQEVRNADLKFYTKQVNGDYKTGFNLINIFRISDEKIEKIVNKQWDDNSNSNQKRPSSIKYVLKGGSISKEQVVTGNRITNEGWNYTFTNVPKYNEQGNEIKYTVEEQEVNSGDFKFYQKEISGLNIINKFIVPNDKISVNVNKQWNDNSNLNQKRPTSIKYVLKGGSISKEQIVIGNRTTNEGWNYTFTNVPKYNE